MAIITPPFRTSLLTANGVPFATDNGDIQTTRDWWTYWDQLTTRSNSNSKLATAGTHADRPMPDGMPEGALYYENDRGVLYASTLGVWQYVAGVMWGTLVPDQRPTDLGTHDAGFEFRTSVAPPREFIWSQTAWVEVASQTGDVQIAYATADLTLVSNVLHDVPGATLTLARAGRYLITGNFTLFEHGAGDVGAIMQGSLVIDGVVQSASAFYVAAAAEQLASVSNQWIYAAPAAGKIAKLQALKYGGTGTSVISTAHSSISAIWIGP